MMARESDGVRAAHLFNQNGGLTQAERAVQESLVQGEWVLLTTFAAAHLDDEDDLPDMDCVVYLTNQSVIVDFPKRGSRYTQRIWADSRIGKPRTSRYSRYTRQSVSVDGLFLRLPKDEVKSFLRLAADARQVAPQRRTDSVADLPFATDPDLQEIVSQFPETQGFVRAALAPSGRCDTIPLYRRIRDTRILGMLDEDEAVYFIQDVMFIGNGRLGYGEGTLFLTQKRLAFDPLVGRGMVLGIPLKERLPDMIHHEEDLPGTVSLTFPEGKFLMPKVDAALLLGMAWRFYGRLR